MAVTKATSQNTGGRHKITRYTADGAGEQSHEWPTGPAEPDPRELNFVMQSDVDVKLRFVSDADDSEDDYFILRSNTPYPVSGHNHLGETWYFYFTAAGGLAIWSIEGVNR